MASKNYRSGFCVAGSHEHCRGGIYQGAKNGWVYCTCTDGEHRPAHDWRADGEEGK